MTRIPLSCFALWTSGVGLRWFANIYGWHWRVLFPVSAGFELIAVILFVAAASRHKIPGPTEGKPAKAPMDLWMVSVLLGTVGLTALVLFNFVECLVLAIHGLFSPFHTRSISSIWCCLPGDLSCPWSGAFPRIGCLRSSRSQSPILFYFAELCSWT